MIGDADKQTTEVEKMKTGMQAKCSASSKLVLKNPKGTRDRNPVQMRVLEDVLSVIKLVFKRHDAVSLETPVFELKEVLTGKYGEDSKLIYDLQDQGGELLSLRYDLTVPFARYVAMNKIKSIKRYQIGQVYRRDQPCMNRGRFREFYQCDFDIAGIYGNMMPDVECLRILFEVLHALELGDFVIKLNHRKILDGLFFSCGVPQEKFTAACSAVDKLDKMSWESVASEMINEKQIDPNTVAKIGQYIQLKQKNRELVDLLMKDPLFADSQPMKDGLADMQLALDYIEPLGIGSYVKFDLSLARGLDYYTGLIYEAVLKGFEYDPNSKPVAEAPAAKSKSKKQAAAQDEDADGELSAAVGSVAAGGRYDNLVGMFDSAGNKVPCVGLSFGVERLLAVREALLSSTTKIRATETQVMIVAAHKGLIVERMRFATMLWDANIKCTYSHKANAKFLDQVQYCESTGIPIAVILGEGELAQGLVKIRTIANQDEQEISQDNLISKLKEILNL